eukprot:189762_1
MGCGQSQAELTAERIAKALIEALNQAASVAVNTVSQPGGFSGDIRITIPGELGSVMEKAKGLPGIGDKVQEFEDTMNKAAEQAAALALSVLQAAVNGLNFDDARAILDGADNCATQYFIAVCKAPLTTKFKPIIDKELGDLGCVKMLNTITDAFNAIPFIDKAPECDIETYCCDQALKGLFTMFEREEQKIRGNPAGEASELLQDVFGQAGKKKE